ncbi:hypothetical protein [Actinophytocola xanthii]|uniref:hypothetical protein n=1 Tax=Actinophytocola xanthii TaxID=1912961 RepID=UPI0011777033|nr:hypothetical protein [Actinophytocola xanthii]
MVTLSRFFALGCAALVLVSCGFLSGGVSAGNEETDRQSETLAVAIGYPRQEDALGFARAALGTTLGRSGGFSVLEATDLDRRDVEDPMARLVWRIHRPASDSKWGQTPEINACYEVEFNYYGASSGPTRIPCPENATAITPPPVPRRDIPQEFAPALTAVLGALPATPSEADVRAALTAGLPAPPVDPETGLAGVPPQVFVRVRGADVGVALFARTGVESRDCMMGHRVNGVVKVWSLNWRDLDMREMTCDADVAVSGT